MYKIYGLDWNVKDQIEGTENNGLDDHQEPFLQLEPKLSHVSCLLTAVFIDNTNTFVVTENTLSIPPYMTVHLVSLCGSQYLCIIKEQLTDHDIGV